MCIYIYIYLYLSIYLSLSLYIYIYIYIPCGGSRLRWQTCGLARSAEKAGARNKRQANYRIFIVSYLDFGVNS